MFFFVRLLKNEATADKLEISQAWWYLAKQALSGLPQNEELHGHFCADRSGTTSHENSGGFCLLKHVAR